MKIRYLGHSSFLLVSDRGTKVVTDPYGEIGLCFPQVVCDGVTVSHSHFDHNRTDAPKGEFKIFDSVGDFRLREIGIRSLECCHDDCGGKKRGKNLIFFFEIDGMTVCHMGDLGEPCCERILSKFPHIDVLFLPVGGNYTIGAEEAVKYVEAIEPKLAIPMHYFVKGLTVDIAPPDAFLSSFPSYRRHKGELEIDKTALPLQTEILFLERSF